MIDGATRWIQPTNLVRSNAESSCKAMRNWIQTKGKMKAIRSDNGKEFLGTFVTECTNRGIILETSAPFNPEENGLAEAANKKLLTVARCLLQDSELDASYWPYAIEAAAFLLNRTPMKALGGKSPFEVRYDEKPRLGFLRPFGSPCYYRDHHPKANKMQSKFREGILLGYSETAAAYKVQDVATKKLYVCRSVRFPVSVAKDAPLAPITFDEEEEEVEPQGEFSCMVTDSVSYKWDFLGTKTILDPLSVALYWIWAVLGVSICLVWWILTTQGEKAQGAKRSHVYRTSLEGVYSYFVKNRPKKMARKEWRKWKSLHQKAKKNLRSGMEVDAFNVVHSLNTNDFYSFASKYIDLESIWRDGYLDVEEELAKDRLAQEAYACTVRVPLKEGLNGPQGEEWREAVNKEFGTFKRLGVYEEVSTKALLPGEKPIPLMVLLELKDGGTRKKARAVALGNKQRNAPDEVYSPVASQLTFRIMLQKLLSEKSLGYSIFDISTAFLHGDLRERVFVSPPKELANPERPLWRLRKSLYGLTVAPMMWNEKLVSCLKELGFARSTSDPCLFSRGSVQLCMYVDDVFAIGPPKELKEAQDEILQRYPGRIQSPKVKNGIESFSYLGVDVELNRGKGLLHLRNTEVINKLLKKFGYIADGIHCRTPIINHLTNKDSEPLQEKFPMRELVGIFQYLQCSCRPDLSFAAKEVARFLDQPTTQITKDAVIRIVAYLRNTKDLGLTYKATKIDDARSNLEAFADADFAGEVPSRKSTSGNCILFNGSPIWWRCASQRLVSQSTMEAELISLATLVKDLKYVDFVLSDVFSEVEHGPRPRCHISFSDKIPHRTQCDNEAAIAHAKREFPTNRSKHLDIRHNYVKQYIDSGLVQLSYVPTSKNLADIFTKPSTQHKLQMLNMKPSAC
ncbi:unnamed protein product [Amoebophrya sp. A25]|nr:unnamed protein product [Amoebophrya sp. A25]|eukprot:GSA25T00012153001.1